MSRTPLNRSGRLIDLMVEIRRWLHDARTNLNLRAHVHITKSGTVHGERTTVQIDHRIPGPRSGRRARWRITTKAQRLFKVHFHIDVREEVNAASTQRGRVLYCIDLDRQEVVAVLSYHIDDKSHFPVLLTVIGMRIDGRTDDDLTDSSRGGALILKQYAHEIARRLGRGAFLDIDASNDSQVLAELNALGFRNAPQVKDLRISGTHLRQDSIE